MIKNAKRPDDASSYAQTHFYIDAVREAGGSPVLLPYMSGPGNPESRAGLYAAYRRVDGLLLAGGNDVDPSAYGEAALETSEEPSTERDKSEDFYISLAESDSRPLLAICRGLQIWNVRNGGTLHQHLPDLANLEQAIVDTHLNPYGTRGKTHKIALERASRTGRLLLPGLADTIEVNSFHHQAINKLGADLRAVAWAEDGVIEAIEPINDAWFALGVQWHPESMAACRGLFRALVDAARKPALPVKAAA